MDHLDEVSVADLQNALDNVEGKKMKQRLLAAIADKNGVTQAGLSTWYDIQRRTIDSWLKRLVNVESLGQAVTDAHRSGKNENSQEKSNKSVARVHHCRPRKIFHISIL